MRARGKKRLRSEEKGLTSLFAISSVGEKSVVVDYISETLSQESMMVRKAGLMMVEGGSVHLSSLFSKECNN